jgi:hypothetical protein
MGHPAERDRRYALYRTVRGYAAHIRTLLFPYCGLAGRMRTRGFEDESRPDGSGRYTCYSRRGCFIIQNS